MFPDGGVSSGVLQAFLRASGALPITRSKITATPPPAAAATITIGNPELESGAGGGVWIMIGGGGMLIRDCSRS